jgi:hypothetical protein
MHGGGVEVYRVKYVKDVCGDDDDGGGLVGGSSGLDWEYRDVTDGSDVIDESDKKLFAVVDVGIAVAESSRLQLDELVEGNWSEIRRIRQLEARAAYY